MYYFVKTPWWLKRIYPERVWDLATKEKIIYLSFDDGPHPTATPFVLDLLKNYNAKATFFCIGNNVKTYPAIYERILEEGHQTGNHTQQHLNGWKTTNELYLADVAAATKYIQSGLFRPPYGRIKQSQAKGINKALQNKLTKIVMWDVLSGDFDESLSKEKCLDNVTRNTKPGSIIVFHDSEKAFLRLSYTLPAVLEFYAKKGFEFRTIQIQ
ncbi:MAG: polysaccharide deacetylase family protein [Bacteroidota bacterium]|nr:polysaccharide deacetylase family protein [Bacteroidota bacterium]